MAESVVYILKIVYIYHCHRIFAADIFKAVVIIPAVKNLGKRIGIYLTVADKQLIQNAFFLKTVSFVLTNGIDTL